MNLIQPSLAETAAINASRAAAAEAMSQSGHPDAPMLMLAGACAADTNRTPDGQLAIVSHLESMAEAAENSPNVQFVGRLVGVKPRTNTGYTGLIHEPNGPSIYREAARQLALRGIPLASEIMADVDYSVAGPYLSIGWIGARNVDDTGPRYLVRPTSEDLDNGIHPLPVFVKNSADGNLDGTVNALRTIISGKPGTRTRMTPDGYQTVTTHANPHVGLILRGSKVRPPGHIDDILAEEVETARERLDREFGRRIPIVIDVSHAHANGEGGGEKGQLIVARSVGDLALTGLGFDGIMAETYLLTGKQEEYGPVPGLSWTDKCIGQENAIPLLSTMSLVWADRQSSQLASKRYSLALEER